MRRRRGFTVLEVVVALLLAAACILLMLAMVPMGVVSMKKAENVQTATLYGLEVLEEAGSRAVAGTGSSASSDAFDVTMNRTQFHVSRDISPATPGDAPSEWDVQVKISWNDQPQPVILSSSFLSTP